MINKFKPFILWGAAIFFSACIVGADFIICPKCGYESKEGVEKCSHCKARFRPPSARGPQDLPEAGKPQSSHESGETEPSDGGLVDSPLIQAEFEKGKKELESGNSELARLLFKNAAALELLNDSAGSERRSEAILKYLKKCDAGGVKVKRKCIACGGTGKRTVSFGSIAGDSKEIVAKGSRCTECGGSGYMKRTGHVDDIKFSIGRARSAFVDMQRSRKFVSVGGSWVPADIEPKLSVKQKVHLKKFGASPCEECLGTGKEECRDCDGYGRVKCTNRDCEEGRVEVRHRGNLAKGEISRKERCRTCVGKGFVVCRECRGSGNVLCKKCNGTGQRDSCRKCGGQGLVECRKCRGSGDYKGEICPSCGGQKVAECSACNGDGKGR